MRAVAQGRRRKAGHTLHNCMRHCKLEPIKFSLLDYGQGHIVLLKFQTLYQIMDYLIKYIVLHYEHTVISYKVCY